MSLHSDTLFWIRANQSLLFLLNAAFLAKKQQIPILYSFVWQDRGSLPTIYRTRGQHANHYATDAVSYLYPPQTIVFGGGRYIGITLSVRPSVHVTGTCFIQKIYTPSSSLLQGNHLPFSPSPLRLNIFRLFVTLSLTQLYRYTPEIFLFSTATFKYIYRAPFRQIGQE
jgi:hypothetical protein